MRINSSKIRELREKRGYSQAQAAERARLKSYQHWYAIESGRKAMVNADTLYYIAKALRCRMEDLLVEDAA